MVGRQLLNSCYFDGSTPTTLGRDMLRLRIQRTRYSAGSASHGSEIAIQPIESLFHYGLVGWDVTRVEEDVAFLRIGHAQEIEKWKLRGVHWEHEIVAPIQHESWYLYARGEIERLNFGWQSFEWEPSSK